MSFTAKFCKEKQERLQKKKHWQQAEKVFHKHFDKFKDSEPFFLYEQTIFYL